MSLIKTDAEIEIMAEGGKILGKVLQRLSEEAKTGTKLIDLDKLAYKLIKEAGANPAFLGYRPHGALAPFPNSICASLNEVVVHGVPAKDKLKSGDVLKIDLGILYKNFYTDTAITLGIGNIDGRAYKLIKATKEALDLGINEVRPGNSLGDIGFAIEKHIKQFGFKVVRGLTGHGIGRGLHEDPNINNYGKRGTGLKLKTGMVFAIEPMVSIGSENIVSGQDGSYRTSDNSFSAHFEDTVAVTKNGFRILTRL